jgi:hypothetical protein
MGPPHFGSDDLPPREPRERPWARLTPFVRIISLLFFGLFLYGLVRDMERPRLMDHLFMQIHAGGQALFRVLGLTAAVVRAGHFCNCSFPSRSVFTIFGCARRSVRHSACSSFFEQFMPIARYMADAQAQQLPGMSLGRFESLIHNKIIEAGGWQNYRAPVSAREETRRRPLGSPADWQF